MNFINLTKHPVNIGTLSISPSGTIARVDRQFATVVEINGVPIRREILSNVTGLPSPEPDTLYIVSGIVRRAVRGLRSDVVSPAELIVEGGEVISARSLQID